MQTDLFDTDSQNKAILNALKRGAKLTPLEMLHWFGCLRASARIHDLRSKGFDITTEMVKTKTGKRVAQYSLSS